MNKAEPPKRITLAGSPDFRVRDSYNPRARTEDIERILEENPRILGWPGYEKARTEIMEHLEQWPLDDDGTEENEKAAKALLLNFRVQAKLTYDRDWQRKDQHATTDWSTF